MWDEAAKRLNGFPEAVLTALDSHGYPVSVRVSTIGYDAAAGELSAELPEELGTVEGPANLLCHHHDDRLWHLDSTHVTGRLQRRGDGWVFVSEKFTPQKRFEMVSFLRGAHRPRSTSTGVGLRVRR